MVNARTDNDYRSASRRLLAGLVLGAAAIFAFSPPASAATTATFSTGTVSYTHLTLPTIYSV